MSQSPLVKDQPFIAEGMFGGYYFVRSWRLHENGHTKVAHEKFDVTFDIECLIALAHPAEGITLTPDERDRVTGWFVKLAEPATEVLPEDRALFERLEAAS